MVASFCFIGFNLTLFITGHGAEYSDPARVYNPGWQQAGSELHHLLDDSLQTHLHI